MSLGLMEVTFLFLYFNLDNKSKGQFKPERIKIHRVCHTSCLILFVLRPTHLYGIALNPIPAGGGNKTSPVVVFT